MKKNTIPTEDQMLDDYLSEQDITIESTPELKKAISKSLGFRIYSLNRTIDSLRRSIIRDKNIIIIGVCVFSLIGIGVIVLIVRQILFN